MFAFLVVEMKQHGNYLVFVFLVFRHIAILNHFYQLLFIPMSIIVTHDVLYNRVEFDYGTLIAITKRTVPCSIFIDCSILLCFSQIRTLISSWPSRCIFNWHWLFRWRFLCIRVRHSDFFLIDLLIATSRYFVIALLMANNRFLVIQNFWVTQLSFRTQVLRAVTLLHVSLEEQLTKLDVNFISPIDIHQLLFTYFNKSI